VQAIDVNKITPEMSNADIIKMMRKNIVMFNLHDDWEKRAIIPDPFK
jgi:hypothetical protein